MIGRRRQRQLRYDIIRHRILSIPHRIGIVHVPHSPPNTKKTQFVTSVSLPGIAVSDVVDLHLIIFSYAIFIARSHAIICDCLHGPSPISWCSIGDPPFRLRIQRNHEQTKPFVSHRHSHQRQKRVLIPFFRTQLRNDTQPIL